MPSKKRKAVDQPSTSAYKRKLRSHKQELSSEELAAPPPAKLPDEEAKKYSFNHPYPQRFSLPENLIYYIARNPKTLYGNEELMKSCKLLFRMSRIIPARIESCAKSDQIIIKNKWKRNQEACINLKNTFCKFWIYGQLAIYGGTKPSFVSTLAPRIHKCSLTELTLKNLVLTFDELCLLTDGSKLTKVDFGENVVKDAYGCATEFGEVFKVLYCKKMYIKFPLEEHGVGKETATKMVETLESKGREYSIHFSNIPQTFDIQAFSGYLKTNMNNQQHFFSLEFVDTLSPEYKNQLQHVVDEIIQIRNVYADALPNISFVGQNAASMNELKKMRFQPVKGILKKRGSYYYFGSSCRTTRVLATRRMFE